MKQVLLKTSSVIQSSGGVPGNGSRINPQACGKGVWDPVMHMQHPVILLPISFQPVQHMGESPFRGFPSPFYIEAFMKPALNHQAE